MLKGSLYLSVLLLALSAVMMPVRASGTIVVTIHILSASASWGPPIGIREPGAITVTLGVDESTARFNHGLTIAQHESGFGVEIVMRDNIGDRAFFEMTNTQIPETATLQINDELTSATLHVTTTLVNTETGEIVGQRPITITIEVSWTASGPMTHAFSLFPRPPFQPPTLDFLLVASAAVRNGTATGSISGDLSMELGTTTGPLARFEQATICPPESTSCPVAPP